jgi:hypothetical protein
MVALSQPNPRDDPELGSKVPETLEPLLELIRFENLNYFQVYPLRYEAATPTGYPMFAAYDSVTTSRLPTADAARSRVERVTEGLAGSRSRSTAGRLMRLRCAISIAERLSRDLGQIAWGHS